MNEATPRFGMSFLLPGQMQKEVQYNEALILLDAMLHAAIEEPPRTAPPPQPQPGQCWIVATGGQGAWSGQDHALACWTAGGWRFVQPRPGMRLWEKSSNHFLMWTGTGWSAGDLYGSRLVIDGHQVIGPRLPAPPSPSGGTIIDQESRAAISALIATLKSHGLLD